MEKKEKAPQITQITPIVKVKESEAADSKKRICEIRGICG
jgi:hypothetical protein